MRKHWNNIKYLAKHKWFVGRECFKQGLYWQGLIHDWSKFGPAEWSAYANFFTPDEGADKNELRAGFLKGWNHHIHHNPHHWQYWCTQKDTGGRHLFEMPEKYAREMVADWRGASLAMFGVDDTRDWYLKRKQHILLHANTRTLVEQLLGITTP